MPRPPEVLTLDRMTTPLGEGLLVTDAGGYLRAFDWTTHETRLAMLLRRQNPPADLVGGAAPAAVRAELDAYFAGDLTALGRIAWTGRASPGKTDSHAQDVCRFAADG